MKEKIQRTIHELKETLWSNPVESMLAGLFCVLGCYSFEVSDKAVKHVLAYAPVLFVLTYTLHDVARRSKRRMLTGLYMLSGVTFIPIYIGITEIWDLSYWITFGLIHLIYLASRWERNEVRFIQSALKYAGAWMAAFALAGIACLLIGSVYYSIRYIFEVGVGQEARITSYALSFAFAGVMPMLFLTFHKEKDEGRGFAGNRLSDILLNGVLTPALLVYALILYLYFLKVTVSWSLPKGAVAYIVISFTMALFILRGCQPFVRRRLYDWFYKRASWVALPPLAMYWVGTSYRIGQYGLTAPRVYLLIVGVALTGTALLFLLKHSDRYLTASLGTILLTSLFTYVPGITAEDLGIYSQKARGNYPPKQGTAQTFEIKTIRSSEPIDLDRFQTLRPVFSYQEEDLMYTEYSEDSLSLYNEQHELIHQWQKDSLLLQQMRQAGLAPTDTIPESCYPCLLRIELDSACLVLQEIGVRRDSLYHLNYITPSCYLTNK